MERWKAWRARLDGEGMSTPRRVTSGLAALAIAAAVWLPALHLFFTRSPSDTTRTSGVPPVARALAERHIALWEDTALRAAEVGRMRAHCAEWDFMGRTFLVLSLANMSLREPAQQQRYLDVVDRIIEETDRLDKEQGPYIFLMDYAKRGVFAQNPPRSLFIDGEIALMLGARRLVAERQDFKALMGERVAFIETSMTNERVLCGESYPDECWMFCNTAALAALRMSDALDGSDHRAFFDKWMAMARKELVDDGTGMLVSSFTLRGAPMDGPEGSSIWMAAHCLQLIDEEFARDQYRRARRELGRSLLGFGYAREWPVSRAGHLDVDAGAVVPVLGASPSASGLGLMGAAAFGDAEYFARLSASLDFAAFPLERDGRLKYCASNQVGDAVVLYAMTLGPLWDAVRARPYPPALAQGVRP